MKQIGIYFAINFYNVIFIMKWILNDSILRQPANLRTVDKVCGGRLSVACEKKEHARMQSLTHHDFVNEVEERKSSARCLKQFHECFIWHVISWNDLWLLITVRWGLFQYNFVLKVVKYSIISGYWTCLFDNSGEWEKNGANEVFEWSKRGF